MPAAIEISAATSAGDYEAGRRLFLEYADWLGVDLGFQNFAGELDDLPQMYGPPGGCLLLGRDPVTGSEVACVGVRRRSAETCEMKRLFVAESARGSGLGRRLAIEAARSARRLGYSRMVLDILQQMTAAHQLYASLGFKDIEPYYENPLPGARFMSLDIAQDFEEVGK